MHPPTCEYNIGPIPGNVWTEINTGDPEIKERYIKNAREAVKKSLPLGPYPFKCKKQGWVKMYLLKDHGPVPGLAIDNGFELRLCVPWIKFYYVRVEWETWNRETRTMVTSGYGATFLTRLCPHSFVPTFICAHIYFCAHICSHMFDHICAHFCAHSWKSPNDNYERKTFLGRLQQLACSTSVLSSTTTGRFAQRFAR